MNVRLVNKSALITSIILLLILIVILIVKVKSVRFCYCESTNYNVADYWCSHRNINCAHYNCSTTCLITDDNTCTNKCDAHLQASGSTLAAIIIILILLFVSAFIFVCSCYKKEVPEKQPLLG